MACCLHSTRSVVRKAQVSAFRQLSDHNESVPSRSIFSGAVRILLVIFLLTLPMINPWIRGDGIGYYAYVRSLLIDHDLRFEDEWQAANPSFVQSRVDASGRIRADQYSPTGYVANHFSVGPAILWAPFLIVTHGVVLVADRLGGKIPADGFSRPYRVTMALATALYGFLALLLAFDIARRYVDEWLAFLATIGIWFASSLPVYMYFNPSWSHALSAFTVSLFLWYWIRTYGKRTWAGWVILGGISGLMMNVYYPTALLLLLPLLESLAGYWDAWKARRVELAYLLLGRNIVFAAVTAAAFLPTLITKKIVYGSYFNFGYTERWFWNSPALLQVCFSAEHGLFSWTPILIPATVGLVFVYRYNRAVGVGLMVAFASYLYAIGCYENWSGLSSFGNRFFVSLTPIFVMGLAAMLNEISALCRDRRRVLGGAGVVLALAIVWNMAPVGALK